MIDSDLLNLIIVNLPNFVGLFIAVILQFRIILRLLDDNADLRNKCMDYENEKS